MPPEMETNNLFEWSKRLVKKMFLLQVVGGRGTKIRQTANGRAVDVDISAIVSGAEIKIAKIKSIAGDNWNYTVDIFSSVDANGQTTGTPDEEDVRMKVLKDTLATGASNRLPDDAILQVRKIDWGGTEYWTVIEHAGLI